nr:Na+/H+ antiporter NhaA [Aliamphritea spongicola]
MTTLRSFLKREAAGGVLLMLATVLALLIANSPLAEYYGLLINLIASVSLGISPSKSHCCCGLMTA